MKLGIGVLKCAGKRPILPFNRVSFRIENFTRVCFFPYQKTSLRLFRSIHYGHFSVLTW